MGTPVQMRIDGPILAVSAAITKADNAATVLAVEIPAGSFVPAYGVSFYVGTGFTGGTPSFTIGDGTTADGWLTSANITEATPGMYCSVAAAYAITGKYYATADTIDVVVADTTLTAGSGYVFVKYYNVDAATLA